MTRIVAFNGSPKGRKSRTQMLVEAFLEGARSAGAADSISAASS